ncbi:hypothetical protein OPW33_22940 [Vibrio europaeus]|uniref:hypothetical protein n=1 Tax=Vibrio europaeus TaxID=300876 RepID=UPI00234213BB|nr:hypothetical protein [Vibrio europaeus]MDC5842188.1 hypothetical protein [Vibrio europaeus]
MELNAFLSAISGAVIGGVLTGFFTLKATNKAYEHQKEHSEEHERQLIEGLLQSIHDEVETVIERYQDSLGNRLELLKAGEALSVYYPLVSDFFSVYNGNSFLIGRIPNNDLRKKIIKVYTLAKGMADSFRLNNDLVGKWEFSEKLYAESQSEVHQKQAIAHYRALMEYAVTLKEMHNHLKSEADSLLRELRKAGVLDERSK